MNKYDRLVMLLNQEMQDKGYSVNDLSDKIGVNGPTMMYWIKKKTFPKDVNLIKIAKYFDVSPMTFFEDDDYTMLESLMLEKGLTIHDLTEILDEKYLNINNYIQGRRFPKLRTAYMLCEVLEFEPIRWLEVFDRDNVRPPVWFRQIQVWKEVRDELGEQWNE